MEEQAKEIAESKNSNRTIEELKWTNFKDGMVGSSDSNRTIEELKSNYWSCQSII